MEKNVTVSILLDTYGKVLTDKQQDVLDLYYNQNLSLAEIAEEIGITRQAVHDCIVIQSRKTITKDFIRIISDSTKRL